MAAQNRVFTIWISCLTGFIFQSLYIQISTIMHSEFLCYSSIHIDFTVYKETSTTRNQKTAIILVELGFANSFDYLGIYATLSS